MSEAARILVVEDEAPIREGVAERLAREGYRVETAASREGGLAAIATPPDLVILDRRLPDGEGLDVLRAIRERSLPTAVIVLSARGLTEDRVEGLERGADDYVTKPFHLRELLARVKAVLARGPAARTRTVAFGAFVLELAAQVLRRGAAEVPLTRREFALLAYLAENAGRAVPREEILERVWGPSVEPGSRTLDFHVLTLRRKIERSGEPPRHLLTVPGVGYRFAP